MTRVRHKASRGTLDDPAERVARVLAAKRDLLLGAHRHRLVREDLEDCLGQAALELVSRARADPFANDRHVANALEQKFLSRVTDRQRALAGRSAIAAATREAVRLDADDTLDGDLIGSSSDLAEAVGERHQLRRIREVAAELTDDQRLVLACQVSLGMESAEFCERFGWSPEKFKKVAQRARARLTKLMAEYELGDRCRRLEGDLLAYAANVASAAQVATVRAHLVNCAGCAAYVRDLRLAGGRVAAVLPIPPLAAHVGTLKVALAAKLHCWWQSVTAPFGRTGASAAALGAGGLAKASVATFCAAGLVVGGSFAVATAAQEHHASTKSASAAPPPSTRTTASSAAVSDVLRSTHVAVAQSAPAKRRARRRPTGRHASKPHRRTVSASITLPSTTPPPAPPSPAPSPPRTRSLAPKQAGPTAAPADTSAEFDVE